MATGTAHVWRKGRGSRAVSSRAGFCRRFAHHRLASIGLVFVAAVAIVALIAPLLTQAGVLAPPNRLNLGAPDLASTAAHPLGTDSLGRDLLSRVIYGARVSLSIGVLVQGVVLVIGGTIGLVAGYAGGRVDNLLMRLTDVMYAFPSLLFALVIAAVLGPGYWNIFIAIGVVGWTDLARVVRGQVLSIKQREFIEAARASGAGPGRIVIRHLMPNLLAPVVVILTFGIPWAVFTEAFLSYVGVGIHPPAPSWGVMINDGYQAIFAYPHEVIVPAAALTMATLAFNFIGDGLRDALDPRMRP